MNFTVNLWLFIIRTKGEKKRERERKESVFEIELERERGREREREERVQWWERVRNGLVPSATRVLDR